MKITVLSDVVSCCSVDMDQCLTVIFSLQVQGMIVYLHVLLLNPSAWSDGHRPHTVNITCRGVMGTARMLHALTHLSVSRQVREQM